MRQRVPIKDRFKDKVAVVTGGSAGIGRSITEELCKEGARVAFTGLCEEGPGAVKAFQDSGWEVLYLHGDMADECFRVQTVEEPLSRWGRIDYLVNNAFSFLAKGPEASPEDWARVFSVGPEAYARMGSLVAGPMKAGGGGAIVNVSSISAFVAQKHRWTYNTAKGAVNTLTKCMALDFAADNIRVNSISPGWIWTREVFKAAGAGGREKWDPIWGEYHMLGRCGEPVECAAAALFLLSDDASFITGTDLPVDAGYQSMGPEGLGRTASFAGSK